MSQQFAARFSHLPDAGIWRKLVRCMNKTHDVESVSHRIGLFFSTELFSKPQWQMAAAVDLWFTDETAKVKTETVWKLLDYVYQFKIFVWVFREAQMFYGCCTA